MPGAGRDQVALFISQQPILSRHGENLIMKTTPRLLLAVLATAAAAHITPLSAIPIDADWKLESRQNPASEWWQTLSIKTVPGVVYQL